MPDDPLQVLKAITNRQTELIESTESLLKKCMQANYETENIEDEFIESQLKEANEVSDKQLSPELTQQVKDLQTQLFALNKDHLLKGVGEAMDHDDRKKNEESAFLKVFKMILSVLMFVGMAQYVFFGDKGGAPKKKDMRFMTEDSRTN